MKMTPEEATEELLTAALVGNRDRVKAALDEGADVNAKDAGQRTPLHWAVAKGHEGLARLLIDHGAEINAKDHKRRTPLDYARDNNHGAILELLRAAGEQHQTHVRRVNASRKVSGERERG